MDTMRAATSASNLFRRALCPGSERLEEGLPDEDSPESREGTLLHEYDANPQLDRSVLTPDQRDLLYLSFALADAHRLEHMFADAGFDEIRAERVRREDTIGSFDEYWDPIESGMGSLPQVYAALPEIDRRATREEVRSRLSRFSTNGRLTMSVEMLIAVGRA